MNEEKDIERQQSTGDNPQQQQQLNQPSTDETSNAAEQPQTINNKPKTEDMEVHHHTHSGHGKKNWKQYFWEFLMLFLAVFCGFLAEYQLEHKIERDRGKQYTYSFYEDLVTDSSHFNILIDRFQQKLTILKTMSPCYDSLLSGHHPTTCLTSIHLNSRQFPDMIYTDRTLMQLKNAGGAALIKKGRCRQYLAL
jgi:hypothetical protein